MPWVSCGVTTARASLVTFVWQGLPSLTSSGVFQVPSQQTTKRFFAMTFLLAWLGDSTIHNASQASPLQVPRNPADPVVPDAIPLGCPALQHILEVGQGMQRR